MRGALDRGIVILDASVLKYLTTPEGVSAARSRLRSAHLRIWPSKLNALEVLKDGNDSRANRLLEVLAAWQGEYPILPLPNEILRASGEAALRGDHSFDLSGDLAEFIARPAQDLEEDRKLSIGYLQPMLDSFERAHEHSARGIRLGVKPFRHDLQDLHAFLDSIWRTEDNTRHQIEQIWSALGLPDLPPPDLLSRSEAWSILHDALGASIFYRAVRTETQARPAGFADLMQLIYLAGMYRSRVLVSNDLALLETARGIMVGRYANVRIMNGADFFSPQN
jgi:hypothetical protein